MNNPIRIVKLTWEETNDEHYDPEFSRNGGGYSQPEIHAELNDGTQVAIYDESCGDFGTRIAATITRGDKRVDCHFGSMVLRNDWHTNISACEWGDVLSLIRDELGYDLLTIEEMYLELEEG